MNTTTPSPLLRIWTWFQIFVINTWLYITGVPILVSRYTITPRYLIRLTVLTIIAWISGKTFVIRHPHQLPYFIARPSSKVLRTFPLTINDIHFIYIETSIKVRSPQDRKWRPMDRVHRYMTRPGAFNLSLHRLQHARDLSDYQLEGPRLTQGFGIIGHNVRLAVVEEIGRWPGLPGSLAAIVFPWDTKDLVFGKIPINFTAKAGIEEQVVLENAYLRVVWQDLESGIVEGPCLSVQELVEDEE